MPHDVVLFDLDGTIIDSLPGISRSINYSLSHFGLPLLSAAEVAAHLGPPIDQAFRTITAIQSPNQCAELVKNFRERYGEVGYLECTAYPGQGSQNR